VDLACLRGKEHEAFSHDNLFHSVLGLMDVQTAAYQASSDIFDGCRGGMRRALAQARIDKPR
jgi:lipid A ethanolaminephosphotransferase